jgi:hypothetical protein
MKENGEVILEKVYICKYFI